MREFVSSKDRSKDRKNRKPTEKIPRNSNLLFNKIYLKNTFFDLPPPTLGTLARHTLPMSKYANVGQVGTPSSSLAQMVYEF